MGKRKLSEIGVIILAHCHNIGWMFIMSALMVIKPSLRSYIMSISVILHALWTLIGYKLKWKHIYCSFQEVHHQLMTPNSINWSKIKKSDIYGISAIFIIMGSALLIVTILQ